MCRSSQAEKLSQVCSQRVEPDLRNDGAPKTGAQGPVLTKGACSSAGTLIVEKTVRQDDSREPTVQLQGQSFPAKGLPQECLQLSTSLGSTQLFCDGGLGPLPYSV